MSPSATPATQSEGQCRQVPRLPRKQPRRPRRQLGPKRATSSPVPACHAKRTSMSPSATTATQSESRCHQLPRLPRKVKVIVAKRHTCHANSRGVHGVNWDPCTTRASPVHAVSAMPATQSGGRCRQVPRLPRKVKVDVAKCHACHGNSRGDRGVHWEPSAPAMQSNEDLCGHVPRLPRKVKV